MIRTFPAALLLFFALPAAAQPAGEPGRPTPTVQIVVVAGAEPAKALFEVLRELLARHAVEVAAFRSDRLDLSSILKEQPARPGLLARVYIDLSGGKEVGIYLLDASAGRALIRSVATSRGEVDELAREATAHIVEAAVTALMSGATIGMPRIEARRQLGLETEPPPPAAVAPPAVAPETPRLEIAPTYNLGLWSGGNPRVLHGPGVSFALAAGMRRAWGGRVHLGLGLPRNASGPVSSPVVRASFVDFSMRALATVEHRVVDGVALEMATGPGFDMTFVTAGAAGGAATAGVTAEKDQTIVDPVWAVHLGVSVQVGRRMWLAFRGTFDIDLVDTRYVVDLAGGRATIVDPWPIRPALQLALGFRNN